MMLKSLNISNFAVIRFLSIDFNAGLNVLTGETGAGKSIIVDALSLLLGGRATTNVVRTGEKISLIEGVFELEAISEERVRRELGEVGVELTNEEFLTVRRELQVGGRSRIFVNDRNVTLMTLKKLQPFLVEIHGQGEQRSLLSPQVHLLLLDNFAGCAELRCRVSVKYEEWKKLVEEFDATMRDRAERERLSDMLQFQIAEIERFNPQPGEEERLSEEKKLLTHAERLLELNSSAYQALYESEESVLSRLGAIRRTLQTLETIDSRFFPLLRTIEEATVSLSDAADTLRSYAGGMGDYTPARLSAVEERLSEFERLKRKYGRDVKDLLEIGSDLRQQLDQLLNWEERQSLLIEKLAIIAGEYRDLAESLTAVRRSAIPDFEKRVMEGLRFVALEHARFAVILQTAREEHKLLSGESSLALPKSESTELHVSASSPGYFTSTGADHVEFHLSANIGESTRPLREVASGGELSRLMLTLRTICGGAAGSVDEFSSAATLVFDEIDTGIGGEVAESVGRRLKSLAATQQILCVTHQAQIARFADHHYAIAKHVEEGRTLTRLKELSRTERVAELARMIGISQETSTAQETSQWLLETAEEEFSVAARSIPVENPRKKNKRRSRV